VCTPAPGREYCDPSCARAESESKITKSRCPCGHPECRPENARRYDPDEAESPFRPEDVTNG
jgi:hypothetical protein